MKIRTGDIYRIEMPKYEWLNQFAHGRILNITFGKYLDYASSKLLLKNGKVAVAPGIGFGINGEGFVRIGLVENENRIRQAIKNVKLFFDKTESNS